MALPSTYIATFTILVWRLHIYPLSLHTWQTSHSHVPDFRMIFQIVWGNHLIYVQFIPKCLNIYSSNPRIRHFPLISHFLQLVIKIVHAWPISPSRESLAHIGPPIWYNLLLIHPGESPFGWRFCHWLRRFGRWFGRSCRVLAL